MTVTVRPAWINWSFHAVFTKPGLVLDDRNTELDWGTNVVDIPTRTRRIGVRVEAGSADGSTPSSES